MVFSTVQVSWNTLFLFCKTKPNKRNRCVLTLLHTFCVSFGTCHKVNAGAASWTDTATSCDRHLSHEHHSAHRNIRQNKTKQNKTEQTKQTSANICKHLQTSANICKHLHAFASICKHLQMFAESISNKNTRFSQTSTSNLQHHLAKSCDKTVEINVLKTSSGAISAFCSGTNASFSCIVLGRPRLSCLGNARFIFFPTRG